MGRGGLRGGKKNIFLIILNFPFFFIFKGNRLFGRNSITTTSSDNNKRNYNNNNEIKEKKEETELNVKMNIEEEKNEDDENKGEENIVEDEYAGLFRKMNFTTNYNNTSNKNKMKRDRN